MASSPADTAEIQSWKDAVLEYQLNLWKEMAGCSETGLTETMRQAKVARIVARGVLDERKASMAQRLHAITLMIESGTVAAGDERAMLELENCQTEGGANLGC